DEWRPPLGPAGPSALFDEVRARTLGATPVTHAGKAPSRSGVSLAAITIEAPDLPEDVLGLFDPLLDLAGTYGDPSAGDPIQVRPACHRARPGRRGDGRLQPRPCCCSVPTDRKSTRLNSSHQIISYAVFCFASYRDLHSFPTRRSSDLSRRPTYPRTCSGSSTPSSTSPAPTAIRARATPSKYDRLVIEHDQGDVEMVVYNRGHAAVQYRQIGRAHV